MANCDKCGKEEDIPFKCKYCGSHFCHDCRLPEDHNCAGLKTFVENQRNWQKAIKSVNKPFKHASRKSKKHHHLKKKHHKYKPKKKIHIPKMKKLKSQLLYWLKKRTYRRYNFPRMKEHLFKIAVGLAFSIFFVILFTKKATNINQANLWAFNLGGVLLIVACIFLIIYSFKTFKEIWNFFIRQRRWIKIIVYIVIMILIWQAFTNNDFIVNPVKNAFEDKDFSKLSPLNLSGVNFTESSNEEKESSQKEASGSLVGFLNPNSEESIQRAFKKLNELRRENGASDLVWSENIYQLTKFQASKRLCSTSHCSHMDNDGKYFDFYAPNYGVSLWGGSGENIAGSSCPRAVSDLWLYSTTGHRETMLDKTMKFGALAYDEGNCVLIVTG